MTLDEAKIILQEWIREDGSLFSLGAYLSYKKPNIATLDGEFTANELEAIAVYMRHDE